MEHSFNGYGCNQLEDLVAKKHTMHNIGWKRSYSNTKWRRDTCREKKYIQEKEPHCYRKCYCLFKQLPLCWLCQDIEKLRRKNKDIHLTLYVTHLYKIRRTSCHLGADDGKNEGHMALIMAHEHVAKLKYCTRLLWFGGFSTNISLIFFKRRGEP